MNSTQRALMVLLAVGAASIACSSRTTGTGPDAATRDAGHGAGDDAWVCATQDPGPLQTACTALCARVLSTSCLQGERWGPGYFGLYIFGASMGTMGDCVTNCVDNGSGDAADCALASAAFVQCMADSFPVQTCTSGATFGDPASDWAIRWPRCQREYDAVDACDQACVAPGCTAASCAASQIVCDGADCISCTYACQSNRCSQSCAF